MISKFRWWVALVMLLSASGTQATHIVGGEMIYKCLGNNQYEITLKVYRDCYNGLAAYDNPAYIFIFNASGTIVQTLSVAFPGSDTLENNPGNPCLIVPPGICVEEAIYKTTVTLQPSTGGYWLVYQRCCRNGALITNLINPGSTGATYLETVPDPNVATCNNSPYFNKFPPTVICANNDFVFDHSATDPDGDSLVYSLCAPFEGASTANPQPTPFNPPTPPPYGPVIFASPYSATNPLGGNPPLSIDPVTGLMTGHPTTIGNFVVGVCVKEYRNGVLIGEHKRDFQFNVTTCAPAVLASTPPVVNNCASYTVTFENNSIGGNVFHWDFGVPGTNSDTSNLFEPTFTFPDTGVYTVTLMVNPGAPCGDTTTATVYVFPTLVGGMIAPDACQGQPVQFTDISVATYGSVNQWNWNFGDGSSSTAKNPTHTYAAPGTYTVTLIVKTSFGCVDTIKQTVAVYPSPQTSVTPGDTMICYLDEVQLYASGSGNFVWQPNYNLSNPYIPNPIAAPDVTTTYYVIVSNSYGCSDTASVTIWVFDTVIVNAGPDVVICPGDTVQLAATGSGSFFQWFPPTSLNNPNIANPLAWPPSTTTYVVTNKVGSCVGTDTVTVFVKPLPNINAGPDQQICEGDTVQITAQGGTSYLWAPAATLSDPTAESPLAFPTVTTTYVFQATDSNSCNKVVIDSVTVWVIPEPTITISQDTVIILGTCVTLSVSGGTSYQWYPLSDFEDPTSATPTVCPQTSTQYCVEVTTVEGCTFRKCVMVRVKNDPVVTFPSAFSPNADGHNDLFRPIVVGLVNVEVFRVYNRWGEVLWEVSGIDVSGGPFPPSFGWDGTHKGKEQPVGVYVYYLKGKAKATDVPVELTGNVTLVR
ncbi:MAG: PKD domain-containing protein [Chitinophagales bacterium]|nr:PKD domain-containing protein [Chitinophagales bacterium]MDW8428296.1 PKD domain-containing protein [Chitinophagales bacterium]